jgi:hypothetical protein
MRKQEIEITISPTGEVSFTVKGVKGAACLDETRFLEEAVGEVVEREKTAEFFEEGEGAGIAAWRGGDGDD